MGNLSVSGGSTFAGTIQASSNVAIKGPNPWIDVRAYGATGLGGGSDDTAAIQAAFDAAPSSFAVVYFPPGHYMISAPLTVSDKHLSIRGAGPDMTIIRQSDTTAMALSLTGSALSSTTYDLSGFSVVSTGSNSTAGININLTDAPGGSWDSPTARIDNVHVKAYPVRQSGAYFKHGIQMKGCWYARMYHVSVSGDVTAAAPAAGTVGVFWSSHCQAATFTDGVIYNCDIGIKSTGFNEGHIITGNEFVSVGLGISEEGDAGRPSASINNNHIAGQRGGILLQNRAQSGVMNNVIYRQNASASSFAGIRLTGDSDYCRLLGNFIAILGSTAVTGSMGIVSSNAYGSILGNSILYGPGTGSTFTGIFVNGKHNTVIGNVGVTMSTIVVDGGSSNVVEHNTVG